MSRTRTPLVAGILAAIVVTAAVPAAFAAIHTPAAPANCVRSQLGVRANGTNGAAGTIFGAWVLTNVSGSACRLYGYPGMQLYGRTGRPIPTIVKRTPLTRAQQRDVGAGRFGHVPFELQRRVLQPEAVPDVGRRTDHRAERGRIAVHPREAGTLPRDRERLGGTGRRASRLEPHAAPDRVAGTRSGDRRARR